MHSYGESGISKSPKKGKAVSSGSDGEGRKDGEAIQEVREHAETDAIVRE